jgi:hypothetical protein
VRSLISLFAYNYGTVMQDYSLSPASDLETLTFAARIQQLELLPPAEIPEAWIDYTCFDVIFVSLDDLQRLSMAKRAALRDWTASGPTLVVYDVGDDYQRLDELERLLGLSRVDPKADQLPWHGWSEPATANRGKTIRTPQGFSRNAGNGQWIFQNGQQVWTTNLDANRPTGENVKGTIYERRLDDAGKPPLFLVREAGFGRVLAFADDPFPGTIADWEWAFHTIGETNWKWYQRNGTSLNRKNQHYWNWLVPGVGLPPVTSFLVLISVFVVVIGPVNYFVLQRMRRLYLLLVTVPLGAGIVTACLFSFALLTDGLGVKGRVRSVTLLDQVSHQAVSCSRQTYYAAIAPSRGLTFPETAAVYPLELSPYRVSRSESRRRSISWDHQQNLRSGFVRSRTQNQFMVVHPHASEAELKVKQSAAGGGALEVANLLGATIEHLVIADSAGLLYYHDTLHAQVSGKPRSITAEELKDILMPVFGAARPNNPAYMDTTRYDDDSYGFSSSWYYDQRSSIDSDQPAASHLTSVLEVKLRELVSRGFQIPARQYVAIIRHSPEVPLGVAKMEEKQSFHVILGRF